jgi:hypothetical protein
MPPGIEPPGEGPFHLPALLHHLEPLAGALHHCQVHLVRPFEGIDPRPEPLRLIAPIDLDLAPALDA